MKLRGATRSIALDDFEAVVWSEFEPVGKAAHTYRSPDHLEVRLAPIVGLIRSGKDVEKDLAIAVGAAFLQILDAYSNAKRPLIPKEGGQDSN
jgi:hypothetical protein